MSTTPENNTSTSRRKDPIITPEQGAVLYKKLCIGRWLTRGSFWGLLLLFTVLNIIRDTGSIKLWLVQIIPLAIFIPQMIKDTHRGYSWLCFVALIYFVAIIPLLLGRWWWSDWTITLLVSVLFIGAMMTSRWLQYWNYFQRTQQATKTTPQ